jgi:hypothetical protein
VNAKPIKLILITVALGVIAFLLVPDRAHRLMRQAEPIQASLESYRQQHGHYPDSISQIGLVEREEGPLYYQRESESSYILWFGTTLGESVTFNSTDRRWH